jgi:hypothetical protein
MYDKKIACEKRLWHVRYTVMQQRDNRLTKIRTVACDSIQYSVKGKAIPLQALTGPESSRGYERKIMARDYG